MRLKNQNFVDGVLYLKNTEIPEKKEEPKKTAKKKTVKKGAK